ncbi:MAG: hydroxyacid dehydrogenase [Alphaproteobacteria bacterium]|nr:hydroxyacid dehydrogenase [Alphaproteobacteria bacterium]
MPVIWTNRPIPANLVPLIEGKAEVVGPANLPTDLPAGTLARVNAIIANATTPYDAKLFAQMPALKVVSRIGIGYDNVNVPDATAAGVAVCNTPDGPTAATAELAIMLMIGAARLFTRANQLMRTRKPGQGADFFSRLDGMQLRDMKLGLVGFGRIGKHVAKIARAMGMHVTAYDPLAKAADAQALGVTLAPSVEAVLASSDVVSLHVPSSPENRRMMNAKAFATMRKGAVFVNAARGTLVDEDALYDALKSGHLLGAGIDVFEVEPPDPNHKLLSLDNLMALPHIGGGTEWSKAAMWKGSVENMLAVLAGERPAHLVNPDVWPRPLKKG